VAEFVLSGGHDLNQSCITNAGFPVRRRFPL
jgi:hypothetical protein